MVTRWKVAFLAQALIREQWSWLVNEASLEIVTNGGHFTFILSRIADIVLLSLLGQNTDLAWKKFVAIVMLQLALENSKNLWAPGNKVQTWLRFNWKRGAQVLAAFWVFAHCSFSHVCCSWNPNKSSDPKLSASLVWFFFHSRISALLLT